MTTGKHRVIVVRSSLGTCDREVRRQDSVAAVQLLRRQGFTVSAGRIPRCEPPRCLCRHFSIPQWGAADAEIKVNNDNDNNNGDLYSALTKISTTRFTIAMYK